MPINIPFPTHSISLYFVAFSHTMQHLLTYYTINYCFYHYTYFFSLLPTPLIRMLAPQDQRYLYSSLMYYMEYEGI